MRTELQRNSFTAEQMDDEAHDHIHAFHATPHASSSTSYTLALHLDELSF